MSQTIINSDELFRIAPTRSVSQACRMSGYVRPERIINTYKLPIFDIVRSEMNHQPSLLLRQMLRARLYGKVFAFTHAKSNSLSFLITLREYVFTVQSSLNF